MNLMDFLGVPKVMQSHCNCLTCETERRMIQREWAKERFQNTPMTDFERQQKAGLDYQIACWRYDEILGLLPAHEVVALREIEKQRAEDKEAKK